MNVANALLLSSLAACGGGNGTAPPDGNTEPTTINITPSAPDVLTCSTVQFSTNDTATPKGAWTVDPGTINTTGLYNAPLSVPTNPTVNVSYAPTSGGSAHATAHLATAFPGSPITVDTEFTEESTPAEHVFSGSGMRIYATYLDQAGGGVRVSRSDDGGATFAAKPMLALGGVKCVTAAIDAGNPDVLYVVAHHTAQLDTQVTLYVSEDGGATFPSGKQYVIADSILDGLALEICPDVVSPSADHVVISTARQNNDQTMSWTSLFVSGNRGATFGTGSGTGANDYHSSADANAANMFSTGTVLSDGGQYAPRVFSDGKGNVCTSYSVDGETCDSGDTGCNGIYVQCSTSSGMTWTTPHRLATSPTATFPTGAISPTGDIAVTWTERPASDVEIEVAISRDHGATFMPKVQYPFDATTYGYTQGPLVLWEGSVLWLAQTTAASDNPIVVVDKTCDYGTSWSGSIAITQGSDFLAESLVMTANGVAATARGLRDANHRPLTLISLSPH